MNAPDDPRVRAFADALADLIAEQILRDIEREAQQPSKPEGGRG